MILYIDTSAFVPLLIAEPTSDVCGELWDGADRVVTTRLSYIEAAAALAMAERLGRISAKEHRSGQDSLRVLWSELDVVELDAQLMRAAAELAEKHELRGYDAVHCAAACALDDDVLGATGDVRLLSAWRHEGVSTIDTNA